MKSVFIAIAYFLLCINLKAQQQEDKLVNYKKYQSAYRYLSNPINLKRIGSVFKKISKDQYPPNVLPEIYPISIMMLKEQAIDDVLRPDTGIHSTDRVNEFILFYDSVNYFQPTKYFKNDAFLRNEKTQIYIVFSKPKEHYLLAELHFDYYHNKPLNYQSLSKTGTFYKILFVFDQQEEVKKIICNKVHQ